MKTFPWRHAYAGLLAAFFVLGGTLNIFASPAVVAEYRGWGYPGWFHFVTGTMEWSSAVLILIPATRLVGSALAAAVMTGAAVTVLSHGEYSHGLAPSIVLALVCVNGWLTWRARPKSHG